MRCNAGSSASRSRGFGPFNEAADMATPHARTLLTCHAAWLKDACVADHGLFHGEAVCERDRHAPPKIVCRFMAAMDS